MAWWNPASWFRRDKIVHGVNVTELARSVVDDRGNIRTDGWQNILTAIGTSKDRRMSTTLVPRRWTSAKARILWEGDALARRFIEKLPRDSVRRGFRFKCGDLAISERVHSSLEDHKLVRAFVKAKQYERAYGGAAIMPIANDGVGDLSQPLRRDRISKVSGYLVFEPRQLLPEKWYEDASAGDKHNTPSVYRVIPLQVGGPAQRFSATSYIHESRLVRFFGLKASEEQSLVAAEFGWGVSELQAVDQHLADLNLDWASCHVILSHFSHGVYKFNGLSRLIEEKKDDDITRQLMMTDVISSVLKTVVVDAQDDFTRQQTPVAGYADLLVQAQAWVAGQFDMPVTVLFGVSPAGLNATGESDIALWDDRCEASQQDHNDQLEECIDFELAAIDGPTRGRQPDMWSVEYNPLRQQTPKEKAETELIIAQRDKIWVVDCEMVSREEAAASHWSGDTFSPDIVIDWKARKAQEVAADPVVVPPVEIDPATGLPVGQAPIPGMPAPGEQPPPNEAQKPGDPNASPTSPATDKTTDKTKTDSQRRIDFIELEVLHHEMLNVVDTAPRLAKLLRENPADNQVRYLVALANMLRAEVRSCGIKGDNDAELVRGLEERISRGVTTYPDIEAARNGVH